MARGIALALVFAALAFTADAVPKNWYDPSRGRVDAETSACPNQPEPDTSYPGAPHNVASADPSQQPQNIKFMVTDADGTPTSTMCPGAPYTITVSFDYPSLALLSATTGSFEGPTPDCPNRKDLGDSNPQNEATEHSAAYFLPCGSTGTVYFNVTAASPQAFRWAKGSLTVPVDTSCMSSVCMEGPAAAPGGTTPMPLPPAYGPGYAPTYGTYCWQYSYGYQGYGYGGFAGYGYAYSYGLCPTYSYGYGPTYGYAAPPY